MTESTEHQTALLLERVAQRLESLEIRTRQQDKELRSLDAALRGTASTPGVILKVDRIDQRFTMFVRIITWFGSGGLVGLAGSLYLLWMVLETLRSAGAAR